MKATLKDRKEERLSPNFSLVPAMQSEEQSENIEVRDLAAQKDHRRELWARFWATCGAALWSVVAVLAKMGIARIGQIELLFLFAPLVIVPLGMELGNAIPASSSRSALSHSLTGIAQVLQPIGAAFVVWAICFAPGRRGGELAAPWLFVCALMALGGFLNLFRLRYANHRCVRLTLALAQIDLAVGGAWLVASRLGMKPMGIQEPIGLLTAMHFHYAGFATATIAAAMLKSTTLRSEQKDKKHSWLNALVLVVACLPYLVAVGFVISPALKMTAAILFSGSVATLAVLMHARSRQLKDPAARALLQIASVAIFAGMLFSGAYAVTNFLGSDALTIPQMARTHGLLNAMGFCLCGLLGWLVDAQSAEESVLSPAEKLQ